MGLLKKIFGETPEQKKSKINWIKLNSMEQLNTVSNSKKTVGIFKHSTRCGTSIMVKRRFESSYDLDAEEMDLYYLDLLSYREISEALATQYNVMHQSPQLLIIKNNQLITAESHSDVNYLDLKSVI